MNWLDTTSFTGLLNQAQKSIDKVLDIPSEEDTENKKQPDKGDSKVISSVPQSEEATRNKSSSSWLSSADSFWGSLTQTVSSSPQKENVDTKEEHSVEKKSQRALKVSKLSSQQSSSKRNNKRKVVKKRLEEETYNVDGNKKITSQDKALVSSEYNKANSETNPEKKTDSDVFSAGAQANTSAGNSIFQQQNENVFNEFDMTQQNVAEVGDAGKINVSLDSDALEAVKEQLVVERENSDCLKKLERDEVIKSQHDEIEEMHEGKVTDIDKSEKLYLINDEFKQEEELVLESKQDSFYTTPVAASTPQRKNESEVPNNDNNERVGVKNKLFNFKEEKYEISNEHSLMQGNLVEGCEMESHGIENTRENDHFNEENVRDLSDENKIGETTTDWHEIATDTRENKRLRQVIEVRESKLVELSKENLKLQETNAVLRNQISQLEEIHHSEDAELEQMKNEFTKRIGDSDKKLQAAAKERDLFKKQLEETQKCLSSDNERQLNDFQLLSKEKDEQIARLMEEGEKLSKEILQKNKTIKKLRAKEKELTASNDTLSSRLDAVEAEKERLTEILKDRDQHEKEQDDAIKKLNAYTKRQEETIAKQKTELEESTTKLPSLQTALDNAFKEIAELHKVNAAKSNEVQEAALSVEMTAKEELRIAMEKLKKESQKECDILAMEVTDLQTQLSRNEQQALRREDNLRQEISDAQMRLQEAESRNQELTQSVSVATRPLLRQIENLQHSYGSQQTSWEKLERNMTERLVDVQNQLATAQEKERAASERSLELTSKVTSLESQVSNYRQEKSRIEAEFELEKTKLEELEEFKSREIGKIDALKVKHTREMEKLMLEKNLVEQQLVVEKTKFETEKKKQGKLEEQLNEKNLTVKRKSSEDIEENEMQSTSNQHRSRNSSSSSILSLSDTINRSLLTGGTVALEELRATVRHKEGELISMQSAITTLESSRESLTKELTNLMGRNENLTKENKQLHYVQTSFQELQGKYNALLQMYGEKQEETEELKLDLQDVKNMYKTQIQELLSER